MSRDAGGMDQFTAVTLDSTLLAKQIQGAQIPSEDLVEARWEIVAQSNNLWQEGTRYGVRLWILQDLYPVVGGTAYPQHPLGRVYEDVLSGVAHVRGPASFFLAPNIRLAQFLAANPTATITLQVRVRFGEVSTDNETEQRIMWPVNTLVADDTETVEIYGSIDGRTAPLDLRRVQWLGNGPTSGASKVQLQAGNSYYNGATPLTGSPLATWGPNEVGVIRDLPPMTPNTTPTPNLFQLWNNTPDTIDGEVWLYGEQN